MLKGATLSPSAEDAANASLSSAVSDSRLPEPRMAGSSLLSMESRLVQVGFGGHSYDCTCADDTD